MASGISQSQQELMEMERNNPTCEYNINGSAIRRRKKGKALAIYHEFINMGYKMVDKIENNRTNHECLKEFMLCVKAEYKRYEGLDLSDAQILHMTNCCDHELAIMYTAYKSSMLYHKASYSNPVYGESMKLREEARKQDYRLDDLINNYHIYLVNSKGMKNPITDNIEYFEGMAYADIPRPYNEFTISPVTISSVKKRLNEPNILKRAKNAIEDIFKDRKVKYK